MVITGKRLVLKRSISMTSFYMPLGEGKYIELVINDKTEDLVSVYVDGRRYDPGKMFNPLAVFFLDCCMEQIRLIKRDLVSDVTKMNELEFCDAKLLKARF